MTDTEDMELPERGPSLAMLAQCAAEARRGDGRLVMIGGEAGVGKTALLEQSYQHQVNGHWEKAAQLWTDLNCPYEAALARLDAPDEGTLREALSAFTDLGAAAAARLARLKLRALGVRSIPVGPRSATRGHPLGLTRREREILEEICAGQTNAAIAARLFISAKTVDHHVSAVLAKLGVPNRNAAAHQAARLGLIPAGPAPG